jgi:hypothetical protein
VGLELATSSYSLSNGVVFGALDKESTVGTVRVVESEPHEVSIVISAVVRVLKVL